MTASVLLARANRRIKYGSDPYSSALRWSYGAAQKYQTAKVGSPVRFPSASESWGAQKSRPRAPLSRVTLKITARHLAERATASISLRTRRDARLRW